LVQAVQAAGLVDTLKNNDFTVLAPTDEAFSKLPPGTVEGLLADIPRLEAVLKYHLIEGRNLAKKVLAVNSLKPVQGKDLAVKVGKSDDTVTIGGANVIKTDIRCKNGIIHVIDSVLIPQ
jgi:transforming growth factor-beta-induced protein